MVSEDKKYIDARNDLLKALKSFSDLMPYQQELLVKELFGIEATLTMYNIMQRYSSRR